MLCLQELGKPGLLSLHKLTHLRYLQLCVLSNPLDDTVVSSFASLTLLEELNLGNIQARVLPSCHPQDLPGSTLAHTLHCSLPISVHHQDAMTLPADLLRSMAPREAIWTDTDFPVPACRMSQMQD